MVNVTRKYLKKIKEKKHENKDCSVGVLGELIL